MTEPPVYLTLRQAARLIGVHPKTLKRALEEGRLVGVEIVHTPGGHHRFHVKTLLAWRRGRQASAPATAPEERSGAV